MENKTIEIFKTAILMEHRGRAFYQTVAAQTKDEDIRNIFEIMAREEDTHIELLTGQLHRFQESGLFGEIDFSLNETEDAIADSILSSEIKNRVSGASFEAAAISAAIDMENKAVEVYSARAESATDAREKDLFRWLANWEKGHLKLLGQLNKELTEQIWYDNKFWAF